MQIPNPKYGSIFVDNIMQARSQVPEGRIRYWFDLYIGHIAASLGEYYNLHLATFGVESDEESGNNYITANIMITPKPNTYFIYGHPETYTYNENLPIDARIFFLKPTIYDTIGETKFERVWMVVLDKLQQSISKMTDNFEEIDGYSLAVTAEIDYESFLNKTIDTTLTLNNQTLDFVEKHQTLFPG